jgi:hypothetical protein
MYVIAKGRERDYTLSGRAVKVGRKAREIR